MDAPSGEYLMDGESMLITATDRAGEVWLSRIDDRLVVDRADPKILVSVELMELAADGRLDGARIVEVPDPPSRLFVIEGSNRKVTYRIGRCDEWGNYYECEWPD